MTPTSRILIGDARTRLRELEPGCVHCAVTSPPYYGLRSYGGHGEEIGDEDTHDCLAWARDVGACGRCYVCEIVAVCDEVWRVLRADGTAWLNLGDSYAGSWGNQRRKAERGTQRAINGPMIQKVHDGRYAIRDSNTGWCPPGIRPKNKLLMPARVALALQVRGWIVRQDIVWAKPAPMPESVADRPTTAHETVLLLTRAGDYFYDAAAIAERGEEPGRVRKVDVFGGNRHLHGAQHSRGGEARERIETLVAGPYCELFARPPLRDGWTAWGNEVPAEIKG